MKRACVVVLALVSSIATASPPEPSGPHPRMLLDPELRAAWKDMAAKGEGPVAAAIKVCDDARTTDEYDDAQYQGSIWAKTLQACLVAWAATGKLEHEATALRFFHALLDDLQKVGDHKGGDDAGKRDSGYAIRNLGPYTALAYDWLHDAPGMTPELRQHARQRWAAWLDWYEEKGYRKHNGATNYEAGYLIAATFIAIAQGGEASEENGPVRWKLVADELWGKDVAPVLASGGLLDGGDWPEGWQYGPLSVVEYSLAARVAKRAGIAIEGVQTWLGELLRRHVYALTPGDGVWAGGDAELENAYLPPSPLTLFAVALGDAAPQDKQWAKGELVRLKLADTDSPLYAALAAVGDPPVPVPRASWPTWYRATATGTVFARTRWDDRAIWFVAECAPSLDVDHRHPNAGNFALSRGIDNVVVDPTPYGALGTLTSNAPTVVSPHLPGNYQPSQGSWAEKTHWVWSTQTRGGVVAARCDYADAYKFQDRKSDVPEAQRDFVLLPSGDGTEAALVIVDRAETEEAARKMYLRFRVPGELALDKDGTATATIGGSKLAIHGAPGATLGKPTDKDCFKQGVDQGKCDAARVPVTDYRVELPGPSPRALHVIDAVDPKTAESFTPLSGDGWAGVHVTSPRDAIVVWATKGGAFTYRAPKGPSTHVVLGAASVTAKPDGDGCAIAARAGTQAAIVSIDAACAVTADPEAPNAGSAVGAKPAPIHSKANRRGGCCDTGSAGAGPIALCVLALLRRRRR